LKRIGSPSSASPGQQTLHNLRASDRWRVQSVALSGFARNIASATDSHKPLSIKGGIADFTAHLNPVVYALVLPATRNTQTALLRPVVYTFEQPALTLLTGHIISLFPVVYRLQQPALSLLRTVLLTPVRYAQAQPAMSNTQGANLTPVVYGLHPPAPALFGG